MPPKTPETPKSEETKPLTPEEIIALQKERDDLFFELDELKTKFGNLNTSYESLQELHKSAVAQNGKTREQIMAEMEALHKSDFVPPRLGSPAELEKQLYEYFEKSAGTSNSERAHGVMTIIFPPAEPEAPSPSAS